MKRVLLYKTGCSADEIVRDVGDYERWFARVLAPRVLLEVHLGFEKPSLPLSGYDGVVLTGSPRSLVSPEPWMREAAEAVQSAAQAGVPVLGVCFGHQLIGFAFGGRVVENPRGWEVGTVEVELTGEGARDALFRGLSRTLRVNQSHRDEVAALGPQMRILASGGKSVHQAIAVGEHVRGVQFHPEADRAIVRRLIAHRKNLIDGAQDHYARATDTPEAERVLINFVEAFVERA